MEMIELHRAMRCLAPERKSQRSVFAQKNLSTQDVWTEWCAWDFKFSSASVWTHKTLLELELFVHSWGPAWTHKAHYKTSLV